jgi:hypothetical protein
MRINLRVDHSAARPWTTTLAAAALAALLANSAGAAHVLGYGFNETGASAAADGSAATAGSPTLNLIGNSGTPADLHAGPGSGVSGAPGDRAFDNTASTGILTASRGQHAADFNPIDGLATFTLGGWFKLPSTATESIGRQAALFENGTISVLDPLAGFRLRGGATANSGTLELRVNRDFMVESPAAYTEIGQWVNFAVTYDGTKSSNNVQFYKGTLTSPLALVSTGSLNAGPAAQDAIPLTIGVTPTSGLTFNPFNGLLDNFRIWDSVVPLAGLEAVRQGDVGVPEPATGVLLALGLSISQGVRRRRHG